jgi:hypothetical protein
MAVTFADGGLDYFDFCGTKFFHLRLAYWPRIGYSLTVFYTSDVKRTITVAKKPPSGGAKLKDADKTAVLLGLTPAQLDLIDRAAELSGVPYRTQFVLQHALAAARKILEKIPK